MSAYQSRAVARAMCEMILARSNADEAQVRVVSSVRGLTRYSSNGVVASGESEDVQATLTSVFGGRRGTVTWNDVRESAIELAVTRAEQLAQLIPEDPELVSLLGPQQYSDVPAFFDSTHQLSDADEAAAAVAAIERASAAGVEVVGAVERRTSSDAVASSTGLFAYHRSTAVSHTVTARTGLRDGAGWAASISNDWGRLAPSVRLVDRAAEKASASVDTQSIAPGSYTVLFEPEAVGSLLNLLQPSLDGRAAEEGRSVFSGAGGGSMLDQAVVDERITLVSDPTDPDLLTRPFTDEGMPLPRTLWIENGVLKNLAYTRFWADRNDKVAVPTGNGLKLTGGSGTTEELMAGVDRGLLVTRLWQLELVDELGMLYTGVTGGGTFLIEGGRVVRPVRNMRFSEGLISTLNNVEAIGSSERVVTSEVGGDFSSVAVPPMIIKDFHFTSVSDSV